jgi:hypothetical protein
MYLPKINKILIVCFLLIVIKINSSWATVMSADQSFYIGFNYLYHFQFIKADSVARQLKLQYPSNPISYIFAANCCWWKLISREPTDACKKGFYEELSLSLMYLNTKKKELLTNQDVFNYINVYAYCARLDLMENNYFKAIKQLDYFIDYQKMSFGKEDTYPPFNLTSGLYNYTIPYSMKHYPFLLPSLLFVPDGDAELGMKQLEIAATSSDILIKTEANYFLMKINTELEEKYPQANQHAQYLVGLYPENLLYRYYYFELLMKQKQYSNAEKQMEAIKLYSNGNELSVRQKIYFVDLVSAEWKNTKISK